MKILGFLTKVSKNKKVLFEADPENREEIMRLQEKYLKTHPPNVPRIKGCCDRADQE